MAVAVQIGPVPTTDEKSHVRQNTSIQQLFKAVLALNTIAFSSRTITAAGDVTIVPGDSVILLNKAVGSPTNINLPTSAASAGIPITVKDYKGDAATNHITFVPSSGETIDGFSAAAAITNGVALIDINYGKKTVYPLASGGWYL